MKLWLAIIAFLAAITLLAASKPKNFSGSSTPVMTCAAKESNVSASIFIVGSRATLKSWSSASLQRSDRLAS